MNSNTETPNTITLPQALFDLEGEAGALAIEMQNVQAVLSFLGEFFKGEELDPNAEDQAKHNDAVYRIWRYPHYRGLFNVLLATIENATEYADKVHNYVESLFEATRHT